MKRLSDRIFCVTLAALLHDIGKPLQRASRSDKQALGEEAKSMDRAHHVRYPHELWTADFIFKQRDLFLLLPAIENYGFDKFLKLASKHHKPDNDTIDELILQAADCASAGAERQFEEDTVNEIQGRDGYIKKPLVSLFTRIRTGDTVASSKYHNLGTLDSDALMPGNDIQLSMEKYSQLMDGFNSAFLKLPVKNQTVFLDALVSLITRYLWCVPSSTVDGFADIPLSDHCITTAAIAAATAKSCDTNVASPKNTKYLLVSGDFTGIQNFIFTLTGESNRNVAKLFRGRSFMVNLYTVLAARMITDACGLPALNALSVAGGKFQLLLPDIPECRSSLNETRRTIQNWIYEKYFGTLKLVIDSGVPFEYGDLKLEKFQGVLRKSKQSLEREKARPFGAVLNSERDWIDDTTYPEFQKCGACKICGAEPAREKEISGENCHNFIETGTQLPHGKIIIINEGYDTGTFNRFKISFTENVDIRDVSFHSCYRINLHKSKENNELDVLPELHYSNYTPDNKTFEEIAEDGSGLDALAVLKADIDNMGFIISEGFRSSKGKPKLSMSRMVSLSRMVNWFFAGYMPTYIAKNPMYKNIYTLFAGGDDLCLIGRWDTMIDFTKNIQSEFTEYTGSTKAFTISAGLELFKPGFPVVRAIGAAEELLGASKKQAGKNCVTAFGCTMTWGAELQSQIDFAENWQQFVNENGHEEGTHNRNAMLYRFLTYHKNSKKNRGEITSLRHRFQFRYDIFRNIDEEWYDKPPFVQLLNTKVEQQDLFRNLPVGISLSLYKNREKESV